VLNGDPNRLSDAVNEFLDTFHEHASGFCTRKDYATTSHPVARPAQQLGSDAEKEQDGVEGDDGDDDDDDDDYEDDEDDDDDNDEDDEQARWLMSPFSPKWH